jgi:molybdopterin synthase catalytic subunit
MSELLHFRMTTGLVTDDWVKQQVKGDDSGCSIIFLGTVRARSRGQQVLRLEYQAYPAMVQSELELIAAEVAAHHSVLRIAIEHAVGVVPVGECSVALAIASAHRAAAIAAIGEFMDALKARVPIWKSEVYPDGKIWQGQGS